MFWEGFCIHTIWANQRKMEIEVLQRNGKRKKCHKSCHIKIETRDKMFEVEIYLTERSSLACSLTISYVEANIKNANNEGALVDALMMCISTYSACSMLCMFHMVLRDDRCSSVTERSASNEVKRQHLSLVPFFHFSV